MSLELTASINGETVVLKEADSKDKCVGCHYELAGKGKCPKLTFEDWSGNLCNLLARDMFNFRKG